LWLADPRIAQVVQENIISGAIDLYDLAAWVIMANHVHIVILPKVPTARILRLVKGATARDAGLVVSVDHWLWSGAREKGQAEACVTTSDSQAHA
jgi:REP element-mobilizing transposase RayT